MKQLALTIALAFPLVVSATVSGPLATSTSAQAGMRMLGPANPIVIDSNGDGRPSPGDATMAPQIASSSTINLPTNFSCNPAVTNHLVTLTGNDGSGHFLGAGRRNNGRDAAITIDGVSNGAANRFSYAESDGRGVRAFGTGALVDGNGDGAADSIVIAGKLNGVINLVFTPDSSYVSIPLSQAALLGGASSQCGGAVPQIWVPLADTNGDGRGDTVILDLNGDGVPDSQFLRGPRIGAVGVPATSNAALAILTALLGSIGIWFIGRHRPTDALRPLS